MHKKRLIALIGLLLALGYGFTFAQEKSQAQVRQEERTEAKLQVRNRIMFVDENGDGICDYYRDHDNDGVPNGQDPDWLKPKDGTGYKDRQGNAFSSFHENSGGYPGRWNKASFRQNTANFGRNVCPRLGPRGNARRFGGR